MLTLALIILLTVVAVPALNVSTWSSTRLCTLILVSTSALSYTAMVTPALGPGVYLYGGLLQTTSTSYIVDVLLGLVGAAALTPWAPLAMARVFNMTTNSVYLLTPTAVYAPLLILFSVTGSSLLVSSASLVCLYLSLELQSFAVYVLAALYRDSETATDAGLTYFLLGGLSSCFILLGSGQLYASMGVTSLEDVFGLISVGQSTSTGVVAFSLTVLAAGLFFKIAAAPFHQWAPAVYDRVPTIITVWLQTMPKLAVLGLLLELTSGLTLNAESLNVAVLAVGDVSAWSDTLMVVAFLSLVVGSVLGLAQTRIKRLLTYSTISHVGFMLLALAAYSGDAVSSFVFYLGQYSLTSLSSLMVLLAFGYMLRGRSNRSMPQQAHTTDVELISELTGQVQTQPMLALGMAALLFSMAGVPPFVGFFAKQGVLEASLAAHYGGLAIVAIVVSVVSAAYYLRVVRLVHFDTDTVYPVNGSLAATHTFMIALTVLIVALYMTLPSCFLDSTRTLALIAYLS